VRAWLAASRLDHIASDGSQSHETEVQALRQRFRDSAGPTATRLTELLASAA